MELQACIKAHEYVATNGRALGVQRVLIVTDSLYIANNCKRVTTWRANNWCNAPIAPLGSTQRFQMEALMKIDKSRRGICASCLALDWQSNVALVPTPAPLLLFSVNGPAFPYSAVLGVVWTLCSVRSRFFSKPARPTSPTRPIQP